MIHKDHKAIEKEALPASLQNMPIYSEAKRAAITLALEEMNALEDEMQAAKFAGDTPKVEALKEPLLKAIRRVDASLGK